MNPRSSRLSAAVALAALLSTNVGHAQNELVGFALMDANTFAVGPTSGQFAGSGAGGNPLPLIDKQPVQGFSAVLAGPTKGSFYVMPDNGFGAKTNSADALLRVYAMTPEFRVWNGTGVTGSGKVAPVDYLTGDSRISFDATTFIGVKDPNVKLGFKLVADQTNYPNGAGDIPVDFRIKEQRLLTGADFDIESVRRDKNGNLWFGEEFGPFLVKTDATGTVLRSEIATPNIRPAGSTATGDYVQSPQNPYLGGNSPNLGQSRGFEGMAINKSGDRLYTLFEGTVTGDNSINGSVNKILRINEFDIDNEAYTQRHWLYQLENDGTNIGDMTAVNDHQFLVIERNGATATGGGTPFKKIYLADITGVASGGIVKKTEIVDLMNLLDPHDLNADGSNLFTFPFVTIEDLLILNRKTLLVMNDNNYPGVGGRNSGSDNNEFLKIRLDQPLATPEPAVNALLVLGFLALIALRQVRRAERVTWRRQPLGTATQ